MGCWIGSIIGLTELCGIIGTRWLTGRITSETLRTNWHFTWMVPVSNLVIFGAIALLLGIAAWLLPRVRIDRFAVHVFCFLTMLALILGVPGLHKFALTALSAGVALRFGPWIAGRVSRFRRVIGNSLPAMVGVLLVLTLWQWSEVSRANSRALTASSPMRPGAPNVLLIVLDTLRADAMSLYGSARDTTPNLARFARHGVRFDAARATAPWTLPSHASLFTGRWGHELSADAGVPLDATFPTLAEYLAGRGYATAGFVANTYNCNAWYGLNRGFSHYEDFYENTAVNPIEFLRASRLGRFVLMSRPGQVAIKALMTTAKYRYRKTAAMINRDALTWLSGQGERPFFMFLNYYDVHDPYEPPVGASRPYSSAAEERAASDTLVVARNLYDDCLVYLDDQIGRLLTELKQRGVLDNTMVIITADHGEEFGEHGLSGHGVSLYRPELHVPLIIRYPANIPKETSVSVPVSLRDVAATIADLAGLGVGSPFPGRSLSRFWETAAGSDDPVLSEVRAAPLNAPNLSHVPAKNGLMRSITYQNYHYILNGNGCEELYDHGSDPQEQHNLARSPEALEPLSRLREMLQVLTGGDRPGT